MTFTEAALEVLRREGRPLHYRKITQLAIKYDLLSHVGRTPEQTMSSRLADMINRGDDTCPVRRVKPGIFGLKEGVRLEPPPAAAAGSAKKEEKSARAVSARTTARKKGTRRTKKPAAARKSGSTGGSSSSDSRTAGRAPRKQEPEKKSAGDRAESRTPGKKAPISKKSRGRSRRSRTGRGKENVSVTDRIEAILKSSPGRPGMPVQKLAKQLVDEGLVREDVDTAQGTVELIIQNEENVNTEKGLVPRIWLGRTGWVGLLEWWQDASAIKKGSGIIQSLEGYRNDFASVLLEKISGLDHLRFEHFVRRYLYSIGLKDLRSPSRRFAAETSFSAVSRRTERTGRCAVVVRRDSLKDMLKAEVVIELRGTLHHFNAGNGMIITTGRVSPEAVKEAMLDEAAPVSLMDGRTWAMDLMERGVGVRSVNLELPYIDPDIFH